MVLVSDVLNHIRQIYSPLNLANIKIKKTQICPKNYKGFLTSCATLTGAYSCYIFC